MGGVLLNLEDPSSEAGKSIFKRKGLSVSFENDFGNYLLIKYKKRLFDRDLFSKTTTNELIVTACGSISYYGKSARDGFISLAEELSQGKAPNNLELFGHFLIIRATKNQLDIYFDSAGYGAPFVINKKFISTSFLACCQYAQTLTLNHSAIFEEIYTGCFLNGRSPFAEIRRITTKEVWEATSRTPQVNFIPMRNDHIRREYSNYKEALDAQMELLLHYFRTWTNQASEFQGDIGLSSGFDSRTVLSLAEICFPNNYQLHSYWKQQEDIDNKIAKKLASAVNHELIRIPIKQRDDMTTKEFLDLTKEAYYYYDGLFPANHGWVREYRTPAHRARILGNARFGLSGIGGEQYRNLYYLHNKQYSLREVVIQFLLEDFNHQVLEGSPYAEEGMDSIQTTIADILGMPNNRVKLDRKSIHRVYCEIIVRGGPAIRNQIENQLCFFVSPFTEKYLQDNSYDIIPFLGYGWKFQSDMITKLNNSLASIQSDYGFSFNSIPAYHNLYSFLNGLLPRKTKLSLVKRLKGKRNDYLSSFGKHRKVVEDYLSQLMTYNFSFPVTSEHFQQDTVDRTIALAILLDMHKDKIIR